MNVPELTERSREKVGDFNSGDLIGLGFIPENGRYFPAVLYPPVPMYRPLGEEEFFEGYRRDPGTLFVVYGHIPFCIAKCRFCHFVSFGGVEEGEADLYLDAFEKEMDLYRDRLGLERFPAEAVNIGGGTATCLTPNQLDRFLGFFRDRLEPGRCEQFTLDVDVSTIIGAAGRERLGVLHANGVDRITIGVQVLDDALLKDMGRTNRAEDVWEAVRNTHDAGIDNICIDLIYGYPGQTPESWIDTLEKVTAMEIDSFQIYRLRIKPHNLLPGSIAERYKRSPGDFPALEDVYLMKELGRAVAGERGFHDDLYATLFSKSGRGISAYHRKKFCRLYDVLGFGAAANNILGGHVGIKTGSLEEYRAGIDGGIVPVSRGKRCTGDDIVRRSVVGPLRNLARIDRELFRGRTGLEFGEIFREKLETLKDHGLFEEKEKEWKLTERGRFFIDEACIQFYHPDYIPFPREAYADGILSPYNQQLPLQS